MTLRGKELEGAWAIDPNWLQPDNTIWLVDAQSRLQKRPVEVLFKGRDKLYVAGDFAAEEWALAEKLSVATPGMKVETRRPSYQITSGRRPPRPEEI